MNKVISASNLTKRYGSLKALDGVDLEIETGRIVGLIGPNGAGKTTALKAILGLTGCQGELEVLGLDPYRQRHKLMQQVCFIADVAVLPRWARVRHLVDLTERLHPRFSRERCNNFLAGTRIRPNAKVKSLSKGMVVQLHLALVMAIDARLLILDEPTLGLDILFRKQFYSNLLNEYFDQERTIVITTHQVEEIEHILTDLVFIKDGKLIVDSSMEEVHLRYTEVMVKPDLADQARALSPLHERKVFGRHVFLFDNVDRDELARLGELHQPSVADLFVATMSDPPTPATETPASAGEVAS